MTWAVRGNPHPASQQMLTELAVMGSQGPCHIPELPGPMGKWLGELHCSSPESSPPPSLEVIPCSSEKVSDILVLLLSTLMAFQLQATESLSLPALLQLLP